MSLVVAISPEFLIPTSIQVTVPVYLEYVPWEAYLVPLRVADLLEILMLGPGVGAVFFLLLRRLLRGVETASAPVRRRVRALEICGILLIAINSMGNAIHLFFNAVNAIDGSGGLGTGTYNGIDVAGLFVLV